MRLLRDPTLHFLVIWLAAPIFALVGVSMDRPSNDLSTALVGWFVTLCLWSLFGVRSLVYQWKALPRTPSARWPNLSESMGIELRLLIGIGLITLFSSVAAVFVFGLLAIDIADTFIATINLEFAR